MIKEREWEIPNYCKELLDKVKHLTNKDLSIKEEQLLFDSEVHVARSNEPLHTLQYSPFYKQHKTHFIVSASKKIIRMYEVEESERYAPGVELGRKLPIKEEQDLERRVGGLQRKDLERLSIFVFHGLARQVSSMPVDLRVEREISLTLTKHSDLQRSYLERQVEDLKPHFLPQVGAFAPSRVYDATSSMNMALALEAADISGIEIPRIMSSSKHLQKGRELVALLRQIQEPGLKGDRKAVDAWASKLELQGWYEWIRHV